MLLHKCDDDGKKAKRLIIVILIFCHLIGQYIPDSVAGENSKLPVFLDLSDLKNIKRCFKWTKVKYLLIEKSRFDCLNLKIFEVSKFVVKKHELSGPLWKNIDSLGWRQIKSTYLILKNMKMCFFDHGKIFTWTSGQQEMIWSSGRKSGFVLNAKSPRARERA